MSKKNIFAASVIIGLACILSLIATQSYVYMYFRLLNGSQFSHIEKRLASGFYFYQKSNDAGQSIVIYKDFPEIPIYVDEKKKADFDALARTGLVVLVQRFDDCLVYRSKANKSDVYVDFNHVVDAMLGVDEISQDQLEVFCGLLAK